MVLKALMMTATASALIAGGAMAQDTNTSGSAAPTATEMPVEAPERAPTFTSINEMTVGDIVGENVYEASGATIGEIDYIAGSGGAASAVVGIGGFLGLGEYTVALPLSDFTYDADQQMVKVDTTKDALKEQPEFDETDVESLPEETRLSGLMASVDTTAPSRGAATDTSN